MSRQVLVEMHQSMGRCCRSVGWNGQQSNHGERRKKLVWHIRQMIHHAIWWSRRFVVGICLQAASVKATFEMNWRLKSCDPRCPTMPPFATCTEALSRFTTWKRNARHEQNDPRLVPHPVSTANSTKIEVSSFRCGEWTESQHANGDKSSIYYVNSLNSFLVVLVQYCPPRNFPLSCPGTTGSYLLFKSPCKNHWTSWL